MYTFIFNRCLLKINFSSVNSPGWTDDSHVLLGMGWISNTIWFVAQSRVEQLCLERLDMLHLSVHCSLVPSTTDFLCQQTGWWGSLHWEVQKNLCQASTGCIFISLWYQHMLRTANWYAPAVLGYCSGVSVQWQPTPALGKGDEGVRAWLLICALRGDD